MRSSRFLALTLSALFVVVLGACGDDDGGDEEGDALEEVEGNNDSEEEDEGDNDVTIPDDLDLPEGSFGGCEELFEAFSEFSSGFAGTGGDALDFGDFADSLEAAGEAIGGDIQDDFDTMAAGYATLDEAFGGEPVDFSDPSIFSSPEFAEASAALGDSEFVDASTAVSTFLSAGCQD